MTKIKFNNKKKYRKKVNKSKGNHLAPSAGKLSKVGITSTRKAEK